MARKDFNIRVEPGDTVILYSVDEWTKMRKNRKYLREMSDYGMYEIMKSSVNKEAFREDFREDCTYVVERSAFDEQMSNFCFANNMEYLYRINFVYNPYNFPSIMVKKVIHNG